MHSSVQHPNDVLLAGALEHLACYLLTGRTRAARRACMLLECLAQSAEVSENVRDQCLRLGEILDDLLPQQAPAPARPQVQPLVGQPWLIWQTVEAET